LSLSLSDSELEVSESGSSHTSGPESLVSQERDDSISSICFSSSEKSFVSVTGDGSSVGSNVLSDPELDPSSFIAGQYN